MQFIKAILAFTFLVGSIAYGAPAIAVTWTFGGGSPLVPESTLSSAVDVSDSKVKFANYTDQHSQMFYFWEINGANRGYYPVNSSTIGPFEITGSFWDALWEVTYSEGENNGHGVTFWFDANQNISRYQTHIGFIGSPDQDREFAETAWGNGAGHSWTKTSESPTPVPLPAALPLLVAGLGFLVGIRILRNQRCG